ncbi:hypothetical protein [Acinetobacter pittii]|uniref:hypothetical protein n=1 Tax=Acinetobacter pittii TaxID=48296 RepID=UPI001F05CB1C|nr:hypothetical protein [Acinetobacter pittii]MCH2071193.1 hypothetical protein [Acinetobacter pittii]
MKRQILLGLSVLMMAGVVTASDYDGTATGSHYSSKTLACSDARTEIPYGAVQVGGCYCDEPDDNGHFWTCYVDYREKSSSSSRSSSSSSSSYSSGSSSYSSPSYTPTPSYGGSSGRFTPTQIPRNPYVLSGQR